MRLRLIGTILLPVVGIAAVVVTVVQPGSSSASSTRYTTATAARQDVVRSVAANGTVGPVATYSLAFGSSPTSTSSSSSSSSSSGGGSSSVSWKVLTVTAAPGQAVSKGDVLATADTASAQLAMTVAQANLTSARARLTTDKAGVTATDKSTAALAVTQALQALSQARASLPVTVASNKLKLAQQNQSLADAKSKLATDKAAAAPAATLTADQSAIDNAVNALASLKLQITQSNTQAENQITSAVNGLASAKLAYTTKIAGATTSTLASDQAAVATAQQAVDAAQISLDNASLVAPVDGVVLTVNITPGVSAPSGASITLQSSAFQVSAAVAEADLPSMQLGFDANVTITATNLTASGKVTQISPTGSSAGGGGVVSYAILVSLPTPPAGTAAGMSAQVSITTASAPGVIAVPSVALVGSAGSYSVRVLDASGQPQLVAVTVGLVTSSLAEVQSGITEGTAVVTGTTSTRTTTTGTGGGINLGGGLGGGGGQFPRGATGGG